MPHDPLTRSIFIAAPGNTFVVADFNQIELRVAAELSQDEQMLKAYRSGTDLHTLTAQNVAGRKEVTPEDRQKAKALNFGLLFGLGPAKFKHYAKKQYKVEVSTGEAYGAVLDWHTLYQGYTDWQQAQAQKCERDLKVRTVTGKLRKLSTDNYYGASANTPVQGSASECMLHALCGLTHFGGKTELVNTVHDEICVECENEPTAIEAVKHTLTAAMTEGYLTLFPNGLTRGLVKVGVGINWAEAK